MVTPEAPVKAVKKAQATIAMIASPPGIQPKRGLAIAMSLSGVLLSAIK